MAPRVSIFFLIALLSCSAISAQDYMVLNLKWPGGQCAKGTCCFPSSYPRQDDFTVEFLAKVFSSSSECSETRFYVNALSGLMKELNKYWPSFACTDGANMKAWEQIWLDNGECSGLEETDYFTNALNLRKSANLLDLLSKNNIRPSHYNTYRVTDVVNAINTGLGLKNTTVLHCGSNKLERLLNVRLCVNAAGTAFIDCPVPRASVCPDNIKLEVLSSTATLVEEANPIEMVVPQ